MASIVPSKRVLLIFTSGISLGFLTTYLFSTTSLQYQSSTNRKSGILPSGFIPDAPHSHGEMDAFVGPDQEQNWHDFDADHHKDEDKLAKMLYNQTKVLCWVMTSPSNIQTKARHVKATWGKRCNKLIFMSSKDEPTLPAVALPVKEGRDNLWGKTKEAFKYIYENHFHEADWFLKADDDTYVILENLRKLLRDFNPSRPIYFGRRFKPYVKQGYMSGGAGYILSKEAVQRFVAEALTHKRICRQDNGGAEDLEIGHCLENIGVEAGDSRDDSGRETFMPFIPEHHLIPGMVPKDNWYWSYNYFPAKEGPECCSDYAITFHYVPPNMMYIFEYFIYHLKPYGISSNLVLPYEPAVSEAAKHKTADAQTVQTIQKKPSQPELSPQKYEKQESKATTENNELPNDEMKEASPTKNFSPRKRYKLAPRQPPN